MPSSPPLRRPWVLASVMAATFMIAIEATIVSTAMPQIAGQLGDLHLYSWAFSAFLLTQTATTVIFGKLADLYGRRPVLLAGIALFLAGSVLCGLAWSMPTLILFRLIQGAGAGAIQPVCLTIVGDLYSVQERGKIQGYLASVWGISSVLGPLAGGLITQHLSWAWIFWINLPIGAAATAGFLAFLHERVPRQRHSLDLAGAGLFAISITALMVALTAAGTSGNSTALAAAALGLLSAILFVWQERRAREPMIAFRLWSQRPIATANIATLLSGMAVIGLTTFLPMYVQGVLHHSALVAGFTLTMMVLGWPVGATVAARNFQRFGLRGTLLLGAALLPVGAVAFLLLTPGMSPVVAGLGSLVMGLGMGFLSTAAIVIIQSSVGWEERGAATASNIFSRNLGSTLGATVLGAVLNLGLQQQGGASAVTPEQVRQLLEGATGMLADPAVQQALDHSLHLTFWGVFGIAALTLAAAALVPRISLQQAAAPKMASAE
ncbi:MDR family MFS transporter [Teichococcus vastitatis]|uniref:MFS transporter n=1 Tax=Teichococcus vastitatis TaxID=2307076 RepID=A0ABS9WCW3_9PROT|nr:MDR family MFS transporter [Pseudoroseomonas vastitatis]MCI0756730.1 MFS transporter [Pseudoroseomonas vastitatis]